MSYLALKEIYGEHNLKKGDRVVRVSLVREGKHVSRLFLYETGASFFGGSSPECRYEWVAWDGVEDVSCDSGD